MPDIAIKTTTSGFFPLAPNQGPFMTSESVGYWFYAEGSPLALYYTKTLDRGLTWGPRVKISNTHGQIWGFAVRAGWETPGQGANTKIYIVWGGDAADQISFRRLDTTDDTFGSIVVLASPALGAIALTWDTHMMGITLSRAKAGVPQVMVQWHHKTSGGTLNRGGHRSTDDGDSWVAAATLAESPMGGTDKSDRYLLFPGFETDEYDTVAFYWDDDLTPGGNDLSWKTYDDSLNTWTEQVVVDTDEKLSTNGLGLNMAGAVHHNSSQIIVCWRNEAGGNFNIRCRFWDTIAGGGGTKANPIGSQGGFMDGCGVHIDQNLGTIYVNRNGDVGESSGATNHYYQISDDVAASWGPDIQFNEDAATRKVEGWGFGSTSPNGGRLLFSWCVEFVPGKTNVNNSIPLVDPTITTVAPAIGPTTGGQTVTITGAALDTALGVSFGGVGATIISFNASEIVVTTPPGAAGLVDVVVLTSYGSLTLSNGYQYIVVTNPTPGGVTLQGHSGREFTAYISPDGRVHEFHTPHRIGRFIISQSGWGTPPIEYITQRGPFQHGDTVKDFFLRPRVVQLLVRENLCNRDEWWASRADLLNDIRPNRQATATATAPGQLRRVKSSGEVRDLDVFIAEGPRFEPRVAGTWDEWSWQEVLRFIAHNPIEFDPTEVIASFIITLPSSLVFPITFPITFGGTITETLLVDYIGTWESLPRILITGPIDNPQIDNTTTGEKLQFAFDVPAGQELEIDLAYGVKTVQEGPPGGPYTINRIGTLSSDSDLATFHLAPTPEAPQVAGQPAPTARNTITLTGRGVSGGTAVQVRYFTRFFGI